MKWHVILAICLDFIYLSSCNDLSNEFSNVYGELEENGEYIDIPMNITIDEAIATRCGLQNYLLNDKDPDGLPTHTENLNRILLALYYDNKYFAGATSFAIEWQPIDESFKLFYNDLNISNQSYKDGKLSFTLSLPSYLDPSKLSLYCLAKNVTPKQVGDYRYTAQLSDRHEIDLKGESNCTFSGMYKLSDSNNWNNIRKNFSLKRQTCEIIVLSPVDWFNKEFNNNFFYGEQYCTLNWEERPSSFNYISSNVLHYYGSSRYNILTDEATCNKDHGWINTSPWSGLYYSWTDEEDMFKVNIKTTYKGKTYYLMRPINILASTKPSIPKVKEYLDYENKTSEYDGKELKYVTCILTKRSNEIVSYGNLPVPENGFQANRRYVYVLSKDILTNEAEWEVSTGKLLPETRSHSKPLTTDDFELIETDFNEPLPFEMAD